MNYTTFFQRAITDHQTQLAARRRQVQTQHARIAGLLAPLLQSLEATLSDHVYEGHEAGQPVRGKLALARSADPQALQSTFILECQGHRVLTIELDGAEVRLRNGVHKQDWRLSDFDQRGVESIAHCIAEWIVPHLLPTRRETKS